MQQVPELPPIGTEPDGVITGGDGFLFLPWRANLRQRVASVQPEFFELARQRVREREEKAKAFGAEYLAVSLPSRVHTLAELYPRKVPAPVYEHELFARTGIGDLTKSYAADGKRNFWRTDFHHGPIGDVNAALGIAEKSGLLNDGELAYARKLMPGLVRETGQTFVGELGSRMNPPVGEPELKFFRVTPVFEVAYDGPREPRHRHPQEGDIVVAESLDALVDATVVVFGTSMVNGIIPPLGHIFSRVIWARTWQFMYWDVVEAAKAKLVVSLFNGTSLQDCFSHIDSDAPAFMDIAELTGRTLALRGDYPDVFSRALPGIMSTRRSGRRPGQTWIDHVIGSTGYWVDKHGARHRAG